MYVYTYIHIGQSYMYVYTYIHIGLVLGKNFVMLWFPFQKDVCVYVCMCVRVHACVDGMYVHTRAHTATYSHTHAHTHVHTCTRTRAHTNTETHTHTRVRQYTPQGKKMHKNGMFLPM